MSHQPQSSDRRPQFDSQLTGLLRQQDRAQAVQAQLALQSARILPGIPLSTLRRPWTKPSLWSRFLSYLRILQREDKTQAHRR